MRPERVRVVVPTYNERESIEHVIAAIRLSGYRVLVVDDDSPDGTPELVVELGDPDVALLRRTHKQGLGRAYAAGFRWALDRGAEVIVQMDADLSHNPTDIPRLVAALDAGADVAIGSRYVPGGSTPDWSLVRKLISRGGNVYAQALLGIGIRDATAGFRAWRAGTLQTLAFERTEASGYAFQIEMALAAVDAGASITEVPIVFRDRAEGTSKMTGDIVVEAMKLVTRWGIARRLRGGNKR